MPGPIIKDPTPEWLKAKNASVLDPTYKKIARTLAQLVGIDDPQSQILGMMMPMEIPKGALSGLAKLGTKAEEAVAEYAGSHRPPGPGYGAPLHDLTGAGTIYPDDVYSVNGPRYYGTSNPAEDRRTFSLAQRVRGNPDASVTVYRAVPADVETATINPGDWVTVDPGYARIHGEGPLRGQYKILKKTVKASEIYTNGDSILEWGYHPSSK